jgi:hypothetical protein
LAWRAAEHDSSVSVGRIGDIDIDQQRMHMNVNARSRSYVPLVIAVALKLHPTGMLWSYGGLIRAGRFDVIDEYAGGAEQGAASLLACYKPDRTDADDAPVSRQYDLGNPG